MNLRSIFTRGRRAAATIAMSAITALASNARAQWTVINLHPTHVSNVFDSYASSIHAGQVVGYIRTDFIPLNHAALWNGNAESFVDLDPSGPRSIAASVSNGLQVGTAWFGGPPRASLWSGSAASWLDLTPAGSGSSSANGASGNQQVGDAAVGFNIHAGRWAGTARSWIDLNPAAATDSTALDTDGMQQVGYAYTHDSGGNTRASLWTGTADSWVNLHPSAALASRAVAVHGGQQVGWGIYPVAQRAHLWTGAADSLVNVHPAGAIQSRCNGVHAGQQVGMVTVGPNAHDHAALWSGTAATWVDLHTFLPANFLFSEAADIWHTPDGRFTYIAGYGYNTQTQRYEALMWRSGPACPADINNDAAVNVTDLLSVINAWGPCPAAPQACSADTNADGQVNVTDLLAVINGWGSC